MRRNVAARLLVGMLTVTALLSGTLLAGDARAQAPGCETVESADPTGTAEEWKVCEALNNFRWCVPWAQEQINKTVDPWSEYARKKIWEVRKNVKQARCDVAETVNRDPWAEEPSVETPSPKVAETARYCSKAHDPDGEQTLWIRFKFTNPGVRSSTTPWQQTEDGETVCETHSWQPHEGRREVRAQARDKFERSEWSDSPWVSVETRPPNEPSRPDGPTFVWDTELSGSSTNYPTYCSSATDPDGDSVWIKFSFPDSWTEVDINDEVCETARVSWSPGWVSVEAKAKDQHDESWDKSRSDWSPALDVEVGDNDEPTADKPWGDTSTEVGQTETYCTSTWDDDNVDLDVQLHIEDPHPDTLNPGGYLSGTRDTSRGDTECFDHTFEEGGNTCAEARAWDNRYGESGWSDCLDIWVEPAGWDDCGSGTDAGETRGDAYAINPDVTCLPPSDGDCFSAPAGTCLDHEHRPSSDDGSDRDWYEFHADGGQTIDAYVDSCDDASFHDMQLLLIDPTGDTVRNEWQNNCREEFSFAASEGGTYRLAVNGQDGDGGWDMIPYKLHVEVYW